MIYLLLGLACGIFATDSKNVRYLKANEENIVNCFGGPQDKSQFEIKSTQCSSEPCGVATIDEHGSLTMSGWKISNEGTTIVCSNKKDSSESTIKIGVFQAPAEDSRIKIDMEGEVHIDFHEGEESQYFTPARCFSGSAYPEPDVVWERIKDGETIETTTCADDKLSSLCVTNKNSEGLASVEHGLGFELQKGEEVNYKCVVTYTIADGKGGKTQNKFESVMDEPISYGKPTPPVTVPTEPTTVSAHVTTNKPEIPVVIETTGSTTNSTVSDGARDNTKDEDSEEIGQGGMHKALLGTATGIVILLIIVALIWFVRKKNSEENRDDAEYISGRENNA